MNKVLAGVGKPIKEPVCRSSTLNFAKRYADANVIPKPRYAIIEPCAWKSAPQGSPLPCKSNLYITIPGTTPLVTISARESSCRPTSLCTFNKRAKKPSKKSNTIPRTTKAAAYSIRSLTAKSTAIHPLKRLPIVMAFGMYL